jgi:hypothetical protein
MSYGLFDTGIKRRLGFSLASELDDVPETPGIYAWYLPMRGDTSSGLVNYLRTLRENIEHATPISVIEGEGRQRRFLFERNPPTFDVQVPEIERLAASLSDSRLQIVAQLVLTLSLFTEPFYVGMTKAEGGLRSRLTQHKRTVKSFDDDTNWNGSLRSRVARALQDPSFLDRCIVAYLPLSNIEFGEDLARLLEHVLIRTIRPAQSIRG